MKGRYLCLVLLYTTLSCRGDYIVYYKLIRIKHPVLKYENPEPLIVEFEYQWNGRDTIHEKLIYFPLIYARLSRWGDNPPEYGKDSKITYYDAYALPDGKGFVLLKKTVGYEFETGFEEIILWDISQDNYYYLEPHGNEIYFTKDKKYLVTVSSPSPYEPPYTYTLHYYSLTPSISEKPVKIIEVKEGEFPKNSLTKPE